ncbi:hypothetical protein [Streptomyces albovinaceus]|uniref:hypothetical protein n=1 Tax=Streptomyces albovinaceus TaxID=66867 RepID=UPI00117F04CD|nr:hypothetical protein [Streptomyces albovinaceus]
MEQELAMLRNWPPALSLEDHIAREAVKNGSTIDPVEAADVVLAMKMIRLADNEPAIRTAWLMACDQVEKEMCEIIARRLRLPVQHIDTRMHAAAASAVLRVISENVGANLLEGVDPAQFADTAAHIASAVRRATGGAVGDPVPG